METENGQAVIDITHINEARAGKRKYANRTKSPIQIRFEILYQHRLQGVGNIEYIQTGSYVRSVGEFVNNINIVTS